MTGPERSAGSVLALAVLVLVALQLLAHGTLLMASAERASSLAGLRLLQARAGAEAGVLDVLETLEGFPGQWDSVPPFATTPPVAGSLAGHPFLGRMRRLSPEYWLVEGLGRSREESWGVTVRVLVWILDPRGRVAAARGGAEAGDFLLPPDAVAFDPERPAFCHAWWAALDSLASPETWGSAVHLPPSPEGEPSLGRLGPDDLAAAFPDIAAVSGTPAPAFRMGACDEGVPWNWGDPHHPDGPCGDRFVAGVASGDLHLQEGVGQGLLAVRGDLTLSGTRFDGVLLVGGSLTLRDRAEVRGMVRVGGGVDASAGSRILGSPCRVFRVLDALRSPLQRPVRVREAGVMEGSG